jgi:subtilisin family serine protease
LTVSAIDVLSYKQESYSSQGPTHGAGGGLSAGHSKPNLAAFANVDTWAWSGMGNKFNGTSAATPHVAGAAALVWQAYPSSHAYHIWTHLSGFAIDLGTAGYDYIFGNGALKMWTNPPSSTSSQAPPSQCATCAPGVNYNQYVPLIIK